MADHSYYPRHAAPPARFRRIQIRRGPTALLAGLTLVLMAATVSSARPNLSPALGSAYSIWGNATPANPAVTATGPRELGTVFTTSQRGYAVKLRFYKAGTNTGTHIGRLWTAGGQLLASQTYSGESGSGWQEVTLRRPIALSAGSDLHRVLHEQRSLGAGRRLLREPSPANWGAHRDRRAHEGRRGQRVGCPGDE